MIWHGILSLRFNLVYGKQVGSELISFFVSYPQLWPVTRPEILVLGRPYKHVTWSSTSLPDIPKASYAGLQNLYIIIPILLRQKPHPSPIEIAQCYTRPQRTSAMSGTKLACAAPQTVSGYPCRVQFPGYKLLSIG
jgi:hypothetical protein